MDNLPKGLPDTFRRILSRCLSKDKEGLGGRIFRWIAVVKRPLTLDELREAISIRPLQDKWEPSALINNIRISLGYCGNLLFIDEEKKTVHFIHSSVKQYLLSKAPEEVLYEYFIDSEQANTEIGIICVSFLNLPVFDKQLARRRKDIQADAITTAVVKESLSHGASGKNLANRVALRLLKREEKQDVPLASLLQNTVGENFDTAKQNYFEEYPFRSYVSQFWLDHTQCGFSPDSKELWRLWRSLVEGADWRDTLTGVSWTGNELRQGASAVAEWIVEKEHCSMAHLILTFPKDVVARMSPVLVDGAVSKNRQRLLKICLDSIQVSQTNEIGLKLESSSGGRLWGYSKQDHGCRSQC